MAGQGQTPVRAPSWGPIMAPLDGSALAERALPCAEALAASTGARLLLVRATPAPGGDLTTEQREVVLRVSRREAEAYLDTLASRLLERGIAVETAVLDGEAARRITDTAVAIRASAIVMATHDREIGRWGYSSVAERVLADAPVPVLLARVWQPALGADNIGDRPCVLTPLDGSPLAETALEAAKGLVRVLAGELLLVHALPRRALRFADGRMQALYAEERRRIPEAQAADYLSRVAERLSRAGCKVRTVMGVGEADEVIQETGREHGAKLVVMTSRSGAGSDKSLLGSIAGRVLQRDSTPLMFLRPRPRLAD